MESDLIVTDWPRLIFGLIVFLSPGIAIADRIFQEKINLLLAPIFSFTTLAFAAIILNFAAGLDVNTVNTGLLALGITIWAGYPRIPWLIQGAKTLWKRYGARA